MTVEAVVFDVGNVLYRWEPRSLYRRLIGNDRALDAFMSDVVTMEWHHQHDMGRDFADTSAELSALYPEHRELIALWGPRFNDSLTDMDGMRSIVERLDARGIPLFGITNFSHEFWPPFRAREADLFDRFRDIVVSGDEKMAKPDPAIYQLALTRFGLSAGQTIFIDDREDNIDAARSEGMAGHLFTSAAALEADLTARGLL
ncbi:HAD family phosphatase [Sphingomonas sp. C3-2]|uniref:HAD family hydrolase n=1 Tax=Sphingomonas sp. C3-2 TaxID=3062169 RepID=UPI00294AD27D|nr:HAD family phosphatase [Sphingomonas sp. C3-2]WOK37678.1 HAD family phosphatase [Sphingomonas sp. C3-2]